MSPARLGCSIASIGDGTRSPGPIRVAGAGPICRGAVPDADDTAGALLAFARWPGSAAWSGDACARVDAAAAAGVQWLLGLQNRDGGWPTFCRGWGKLPFDRSGADLTAHALRALRAWRQLAAAADRACCRPRLEVPGSDAACGRQLGAALVRQPGSTAGGESRVRDGARPVGLQRTGGGRHRGGAAGRGWLAPCKMRTGAGGWSLAGRAP